MACALQIGLMGGHRDLKAWQHAKTLAVECAKAARRFPPEEQVGLGDQLRRAIDNRQARTVR